MALSLQSFQYLSTPAGKIKLVLATAIALIGSYFVIPFLPPVLGWENGLIENIQVVILLFGGCWAYSEAKNAKKQPERTFWWVIMPLWFAMALRELSWGATLLMPLYIDPVTGPIFSSSQQLFYKPLITPVLSVMLLVQALAALRWRIYSLWPVLWRARAIPLLEIAIFIACFLVSTAAESHMGMSIPGLDEGSLQLLEEWAELLAYMALFAAQARVMLALRSPAAAAGKAR